MKGRALACWLVLLSCAPLALPEVAAAEENEKREVPDYDGREDPTTAGDVLIWVPRILLSPLYLVSEYVIRVPLGFLVTEAERAGVPSFLYDLFLFGPDHKAGLLPTFFLDFGFEPSIGLYFFWNDAFADGNDINVRGAFWGDEWLSASISDRVHLDDKTSVALHASGLRRPDYVYFGEGARSLQSDRSRYGAITLEGGADLDVNWSRASRVRIEVGLRKRDFRPGGFGDDPTLSESIDDGTFEEPYAYSTGYTILYNRALLALDSREPSPSPGTGVRLELRVEQGSEVARDPNAYIRYTAALGGYYDLDDHGRVISLWGGVSFADPLQGDVPFTELCALGGSEAMRGFVEGRLVGRSAAVMSFRYHWPVWIALDGSIQLSFGNVFDEHLRDFKPSLLRFSGTIGIESVGKDSSIELLFGMGSETFAQGGEITSFRLVFGSHYGF
ncbi:MAG TPA: BamA/TamA family outer membrane protein [Polyangiales bacterium]|nr:BamA/TamA family outer membrane protein [Polyangiales bacterium]